MRRELAAWAVVLLALTLLAGFAWLTWSPSHPVFERLAGWPLVGPPVERLRRIYLPPAGSEAPAPDPLARRSSDAGRAMQPAVSQDPMPPRESMFLGIGAALRRQPRADSELVLETVRLDRYGVVERAEGTSWVLVSTADGRQGWVDVDAPRNRTPPLGNDPRPPAPLAARPPRPEVLELAETLFVGEVVERESGGYRVRSDSLDEAMLAALDERLATIESVYAERYGVRPIGEPAETLVVFALERSYRVFEGRRPELRGLGSTGHAVGGVAALFVGDRSPREVVATAVHEVTHLLNRRALGPALPPWLEEGLADEAALLSPGRAGGGSPYADNLVVDGRTIRGRGPLAALARLLDHLDTGELPSLETLVAQDWSEFRSGPRGRDLYTHSGFFLHHLLESSPRTAAALRAYLAEVARGAPATGERLVAALDTTWAELDRDFRAWLVAEGEAVGAGLLRERRAAGEDGRDG